MIGIWRLVATALYCTFRPYSTVWMNLKAVFEAMSYNKPVFLVRKATPVKLVDVEGHYDPDQRLNVLSGADSTPLVVSDKAPPTHSKTKQAPGDDDPDPDITRCY